MAVDRWDSDTHRIRLAILILVRHRIHRIRTISDLVANRSEWVTKHPLQISKTADPKALADHFSRDRLVRIGNFLSADSLQLLRSEAGRQHSSHGAQLYFRTHKKGKTLSYENIHRYAHGLPGLLSLTRIDGLGVSDRRSESLSHARQRPKFVVRALLQRGG